MSENQTNSAYAPNLIAHISTILSSDEFLNRHRRSPKDFTRKRCLPFETLLFFLMNLVKRSLQDELDEFFSQLNGDLIPTRTVTKSAFSQARKKLKHGAFIELNKEQVERFYDHNEYQTWHGFRLCDLDGSTAQLPSSVEAIADHFGQWNPAKGDPCPIARVSQLYDPLNHITLDALITPKAQGERVLAALHFENLIARNDLHLMDRGYPAFWFFALILSKGGHFCARMPLGLWGVVDDFLKTDQNEAIVELKPSHQAIKECQQRGLPTDSFHIRLTRIELETGEIEVLATSLLDTEAYPYEVFKELYHLRWPVEERYKVMKSRIEIENFSGKSVESIYQDFHAKVFTMNLTDLLTKPAQIVIEQNNKNKKLDYQINFTQLLSKMKYTVCLLFTKTRETVVTIIEDLIEVTIITVEPIRPNRSYPRKKKVKPKRFAMNYKPIR